MINPIPTRTLVARGLIIKRGGVRVHTELVAPALGVHGWVWPRQ